MNNELINSILKEACLQKQAELLSNINRILSLNLDDAVIQKGTKLLDLLDKLSIDKDSTLVEKFDLSEVKKKIEKSMQLFQEANEDLFSLHDRLIRESERNTSKKQ